MNGTITRAIWIVGTGAILLVALVAANRPSPRTPLPAPVFLHVFAEVPSDREGYRKYVGESKRFTITGTLLGIYDEQNVPRGAIGAVALGRTSFYFAKDFKFSMKPGSSAFYAPAAMNLPDELLK
jgi:hypothetical protein